MLRQLYSGKLKLDHVNVSDDEVIQNIVLSPKDKPSVPAQPFYGQFKYKDESKDE